jgi:D-sedoheptulose 7-phosphate isomerase
MAQDVELSDRSESEELSRAELARRHFIESAELKRLAAGTMADMVAKAADLMASALRTGGKVLVCGNGGSAADAQHFAGEMVGRFKLPGRRALPVIALTTDSTVLTCVANDFSYEEVFSRQVEALARTGDVLLAISTGGRSPNVLNAVRTARSLGAITIALVGAGGGPLAGEVDLALVVPSADTALVQECHMTAIHAICELIEAGPAGDHGQ